MLYSSIFFLFAKNAALVIENQHESSPDNKIKGGGEGFREAKDRELDRNTK